MCELLEVYKVVIHVMLTQIPKGKLGMSELVEAAALCCGLESVAWDRVWQPAQERQRQAVVLRN